MRRRDAADGHHSYAAPAPSPASAGSVSPYSATRPCRRQGSGTPGGGLGRKEPIALRGEDEVALGQAVDLVRPDLHHHLPPGELQVGVVPLLLGHGADAVDEGQRALEVPKLVRLAQVLVAHGLPTRLELAEQFRDPLGADRRHASAAGYALLVGERHGREKWRAARAMSTGAAFSLDCCHAGKYRVPRFSPFVLIFFSASSFFEGSMRSFDEVFIPAAICSMRWPP